ncbi:hypothetical protein TSUD_246100 [Trifolium subterraneum]|uniref:Exocyst subunit Exo70 family protein n=1 Tax=Trifolium subterraneum TaxID=3900 RepID=A0A2Z6LL88_TRISU|nr:hypothetical protein TSUD_246100 [Trifolium subterraneum]
MNPDAQQADMDLGPVTHVNLLSQKGKSDSEYISLDDCKNELVEMSHKLNRVIWQQLPRIGSKVFPDSGNFDRNKEMTDIKNDLHKTVKKMLEDGFQTECIKVYNISRSKFLNKCLCRLGLQDLNLWDVEDENVGNLISTFHTALGILFPHESRLLQHIFAGLNLESSILNMLEWKRVEIELWVKFMVLQSRIRSNFLPEASLGYGIHPLTRGVMNCIRRVCEVTDNIAYFDIHSIIQMLESTLDAKSRNYINPAFGYLFTLNNNRYMQFMARYKPLRLILGDDWRQIHKSKERQNIRDYLRFIWNKVLNLMENNESMAANVAVESMRLFHLHFSDICRVQFTCFSVENKLKERIRRSMKKMLLPLYEKFIVRFKDVVGENVANQHIKFGMSDLEDRLDGLFSERQFLKEPWKRAVEASGLRKRAVEPSRHPYIADHNSH